MIENNAMKNPKNSETNLKDGICQWKTVKICQNQLKFVEVN